MTYNEIDTLETTVREIAGVLTTMGDPHEIVIVDDGSTDGSGDVADLLSARLPCVRVVHHPANLGLGGVYRTGFAETRGDVVSFFPADGQFPASILPDFRRAITNNDMVLGYLPDRRGSVVGQVLSGVERMLYRGLFGRMPRFQGVLMYRTTLLPRFRLRSEGRGWAVLMELILRADRGGCRLVSMPTGFRPRQHGVSKVQNWRTIVSNVRQMLALRRLL
jgi:glycosyltransferase involved in cell wall biosynthesis